MSKKRKKKTNNNKEDVEKETTTDVIYDWVTDLKHREINEFLKVALSSYITNNNIKIESQKDLTKTIKLFNQIESKGE